MNPPVAAAGPPLPRLLPGPEAGHAGGTAARVARAPRPQPSRHPRAAARRAVLAAGAHVGRGPHAQGRRAVHQVSSSPRGKGWKSGRCGAQTSKRVETPQMRSTPPWTTPGTTQASQLSSLRCLQGHAALEGPVDEPERQQQAAPPAAAGRRRRNRLQPPRHAGGGSVAREAAVHGARLRGAAGAAGGGQWW